MAEQLQMPVTHDPGKSRKKILAALKLFPALKDKINRALLIELHNREIISIDDIEEAAQVKTSKKIHAQNKFPQQDDNVQTTKRWDEIERRYVEKSILEHSANSFTAEEIDDIVNLARKRDEVKTLEEIANLSAVSFRVLAKKVKQFCALPLGQSTLAETEAMGVRVALIRQLISEQLEFIGVAKKYLTIRDFEYLIERIIGETKGMGQIGGKAAGMFLAHRIIERAKEEDKNAPDIPIAIPESFFIRSDLIRSFVEHNGLIEIQNQKYKDIGDIRNDYPMILNVFKNAEFPRGALAPLKDLLKRVGKHPLIIRSSSLLEDRFGTAFAGKYRSVFLPNQGSFKDRLNDLLGGIAEVYASMLHPDPISYRQEHNLLDYDDHMGILIQKVIGKQHGHYFFPSWAGVAFSRNQYRWSEVIDRKEGLIRIVMGLGTRAVDRVGGDYPRMIALSHPTLKPTATEKEIRRYSQRFIDTINLEENRFEKILLKELPEESHPQGLAEIISIDENGSLREPLGTMLNVAAEQMVITFDRFSKSAYPKLIQWMLKVLEKAYGLPIDIEFAFDGEKFYLLQCRPQAWRPYDLAVKIPKGIAKEDKIFSASKNVTAGKLEKIKYIILIDPKDYEKIATEEKKFEIGRIVHRLNNRLKDSSFILMGPGRWGSNDINLGVKVGYADINHTKLLVEIARSKGEYLPEVSYGTHFFQDLVEANILYLSLYPDLEKNIFNEKFLQQSTNMLAKICPEDKEFSDFVRVIDVPQAGNGKSLSVAMDSNSDKALAYLA